jgi:hypothetical protein
MRRRWPQSERPHDRERSAADPDGVDDAAVAQALEQPRAAPAAVVARLSSLAGNQAVNALLRVPTEPTGMAGVAPAPAADGGTAQRPAWATEEFKQRFVATILAEALSGQGQETDIGWVYFNLTSAAGGESGLAKSTAYRDKKPLYKVWLHMQGDTTYADDALPQDKNAGFQGYPTVADYCTRNGWVRQQYDSRGTTVRDQFEQMFAQPDTNPIKGWTGQGNLLDVNNKSNNDIYWTKARAYLWLQKNDDTVPKLIKEIGTGRGRQFVFNGDAIRDYYDKHPLPDPVPQWP